MSKRSPDIVIYKEKPGTYVSYCTVLDLYSMGRTRKEARKNIIEAAELFVGSCLERGTLGKVLKDLHDAG